MNQTNFFCLAAWIMDKLSERLHSPENITCLSYFPLQGDNGEKGSIGPNGNPGPRGSPGVNGGVGKPGYDVCNQHSLKSCTSAFH